MDQNGSNQNLAQHNNLCRSGCGFYGNSAFEGMCSKCYKDSVQRRNQNPSPIQVQGRTSPSAVASAMANLPESVKSSVAAAAQSIETGSTTVPSTSSSQPAATEKEDNTPAEPSLEAAAAPVTATDDKQEEKEEKKPPKKNRCHTCKKKVGLTGFMCRCGGLYCGLHRYSDKHECTFDYKELAQEQIRKANPVIVGEKINKI